MSSSLVSLLRPMFLLAVRKAPSLVRFHLCRE